ncbi:MAG TPA: hypothetical protein VE954_38955 [Oligoflexus sp.]|uniref:hypothetical protein n=1 Tax=Oligoflexus sp. TaxID=1971216 RepID=UPI002D2D470D|nr:hypothetical protein [Oligoflexus sp.]HYX39121.1 hypothetical protein [Oligoflexus sp.]
MRPMKAYLWILACLLMGQHSALQGQTETTKDTSSASQEAAPEPQASKEKLSDVVTDDTALSQGEDQSKPGFAYQVKLAHSVGAKTDTDPLTTLDAIVRYKFNDVLSWRVVQRFSKLYRVDPEEDEIQLADTSVYVTRSVVSKEEGPAQTGISVSAEATLPVSKFSREQKVTTVAGATVSATREFGLVSATLAPFFRYHVNQYKTLDKDDAGVSLVRYRVGVTLSASVKLPYDLSLDGTNQWVERHYEDPPYGSHPPEHDYLFDIGLGYAMDPQTSFGIGYSQGDRAEQLGVVNVNLYDVETTSYYISASRKF